MNPLMKQNYSAFPEEAFLLRSRIRMGSYDGHTAGMAPGYAQGNVVILPADQAEDFERFCALNPKPCPVLGRSQPGEYWLHTLGEEIDIRTDVPRYRLWVRGVLAAETTDIREVWREDLVTFVLGCSFSFEQALIEAGILLRHVQQGRNVAMYKTSIDLVPAGLFRGKMVVSMRPLSLGNARRASAITARMPRVHGAPIHIGDAAALGIEDLCRPDFGDPIAILPDEVPVFWACGVSPQAAIMEAKPEFCITHAPGCMLITDIRNRTLMSR